MLVESFWKSDLGRLISAPQFFPFVDNGSDLGSAIKPYKYNHFHISITCSCIFLIPACFFSESCESMLFLT